LVQAGKIDFCDLVKASNLTFGWFKDFGKYCFGLLYLFTCGSNNRKRFKLWKGRPIQIYKYF